MAWGVLDWLADTPELDRPELLPELSPVRDEECLVELLVPADELSDVELDELDVDGLVVDPALLAWPMPKEAPSAPTIPSPASPAWSRLLRWRGVMSRRCCRFL